MHNRNYIAVEVCVEAGSDSHVPKNTRWQVGITNGKLLSFSLGLRPDDLRSGTHFAS
jgi:hypothetical protein